MRCGVITLVIVSGCAPATPPGDCPPRIDVPGPTTTPVGTAVDLQVRFLNGRAREVHVTELTLSSDALSFGTEARELTLQPGTCAAPSEHLLTLRFSPTRPGRQLEQLSALLDGARVDTALHLSGTGPLLDAPTALSLGVLGLWASPERLLEVRNVGTLETAFQVRVESVRSANAATSADELCLGSVDAGRCSAIGPVLVQRSERLPVRVVPRSAGPKAWDVELVAELQRRTVRLTGTVVDTSGCALRTPATVDFGLPVPPARARRTIRVENTGTSPCVVQSARTTDSRFALARPPNNLVLSPGEVGAVEVELTLAQVKSATAMLRLQVLPREESAPASVDVRLEAMSGSLACLATWPSDLDFGSAPSRCSGLARQVALTNTCERPVVLTSFEVVGEPFVLVTIPASKAILPSSSATVAVARRPWDSVGLKTGVVRVTHEDGTQLLVSLLARLEPGPTQTDTFRFERRPQADLVFILDDSPSFARHHAHVRAQLDQVATRLGGIDGRVAVTTMGQGEFRALDGGLRWTALRTATDRENFRALTELTSSGAEGQSCLDAAARSVTPPLSSDPTRNGAFHRASARLLLVCITDDAERSAMPEFWRSQLQSLDAGLMSYSVFGPFGTGCQVDASDLDGGHEANVRAFNGISEDLCSQWSSWFTPGPFAHRTVYYLTASPRPEPLVVHLDGALLAPANAMGVEQWRYESAINSVRLSEDLVAGDPTLLTVTYETNCH